MQKNINIFTLVKQFILLISASLVLPNLMAATTSLTFDASHKSLSQDNSIYRLQNHTFEPSNVWDIRVEEGFLVKDTEITDVWNQVGGKGKFHSSIYQDHSVSRSVLISSALRIKATNGTEFRFCQTHLSSEKTMKKQVIVEVGYLEDVLRIVGGQYKQVKEWWFQKVNLSEGGTFVEINLSSKNVYEVLVHALDAQGAPVMIVIDQVVLHHKNGSCS